MEQDIECCICQRRPARFRAPPICVECRTAVAKAILTLDPQLLKGLWQIDDSFAERKAALLASTYKAMPDSQAPTEDIAADETVAAARASVAHGLLVLGHKNDPLIVAAISILNGVSADENDVGASALEVIFDERLRTATTLRSLRDILG